MAEYVERELFYGDFEKCNDNNPKWTPGRVKTLIARQPAADVAPVRHGKWKFEDDTKMIWTTKAICSACGCVVAHNVDLSMEYGKRNHLEQYKYCPNCGAVMDLEE